MLHHLDLFLDLIRGQLLRLRIERRADGLGLHSAIGAFTFVRLLEEVRGRCVESDRTLCRSYSWVSPVLDGVSSLFCRRHSVVFMPNEP